MTEKSGNRATWFFLNSLPSLWASAIFLLNIQWLTTRMQPLQLVLTVEAYLFGISLLSKWKDGIRGADLIILSFATSVIALLANVVVFFFVGFAGCIMHW
jgi:hypothetical protein